MTTPSSFDEYLFTPYRRNAAPAPLDETDKKVPNTNAVGHSILRHQSIQSDGSRDVRVGVLQEDPHEVFSELLTAEHKEDVKTAYDLWNFLEPFFVPLTGAFLDADLLDSALLREAQAALVAGESPHFSAVWAVEDVVNWDAVQGLAVSRLGGAFPIASLLASFRPPPKTKRQLESEIFFQHVQRLTEVHDSSLVLLDVLRRAALLNEEAEISSKQSRRQIFDTLVNFAKIQLRRLRDHHVADSLEEFFVDYAPSEPKAEAKADLASKAADVLSKAEVSYSDAANAAVLAIFEDGIKIKVRKMTTTAVQQLLETRWRESGSMGDLGESAQPTLELPGSRVGPFCHICREAKPAMYKCYAKRRCARRFCGECLRLHNFPTPSTISGSWNCTVCAHLCTCDRCVRQVYIESAETFLAGCGASDEEAEFPGEEIQMEELVKKFPESHFGKNYVKANTSPIKRQTSNATVGKGRAETAPSVGGEELGDVNFLTTVQQGRLRENERLAALTRTLTAVKNEHSRRIGNLKILIKLAKAEIEGDKILDVDALVKDFFPNPKLKISDEQVLPDDTELLAEYFALIDGLTVKAKRARTLPADSDTEDDAREAKRAAKFRKVAEIEGNVDYLLTVAPMGVAVHAERKHKELLNVGFSGGLAAAKLRQFR